MEIRVLLEYTCQGMSRDTVGSLENTGNRYKVNEHVH